MTDNLRARIAAVHQAHRWGVFRCDDGYARTCCRCQWRELADGPTHAEHLADAVIRELGLRQEWAPADVESDGYVNPDTQWTYDRRKDAAGRASIFDQIMAHRYVTEWTTDE